MLTFEAENDATGGQGETGITTMVGSIMFRGGDNAERCG